MLKVAMPFCGLTVSVPARPVPPARASVTGSAAVGTGLPSLSSTTTVIAGEIVACVSDKRDGIGQQAIDKLNDDKAEVESHADGEREAKVLGRMGMCMPMGPMRVGVAVIVVVVIVGHAPSPNRLGSPYAQSVALSRPPGRSGTQDRPGDLPFMRLCPIDAVNDKIAVECRAMAAKIPEG